MEIELLFAKQTFDYGSHHFCVMNYENKELNYQKTQSKHALNHQVPGKVFLKRKKKKKRKKEKKVPGKVMCSYIYSNSNFNQSHC